MELERLLSAVGGHFAIDIAQRELVGVILSRRSAHGGKHFFLGATVLMKSFTPMITTCGSPRWSTTNL
jgi:hypothetical protein